jgi:AraC family transcriptional regulator, regulatory protein of adaptative response / methylated-DNA-[protein]-cysteine methyltransferase
VTGRHEEIAQPLGKAAVEVTVTTYSTDEARWQAVITRDRRAEGAFFFSVKTTGVYCRPSCGARLPLRKNVAFHGTQAEARSAGFRPCKRCRPDGDTRDQELSRLVVEACRTIQATTTMPALETLARRAGLAPQHFHRVFKRLTGVTPRAYAAGLRAETARRELQEAPSVTDSIYSAGFNTSSRFYAAAPRILGMQPTAYRRGGAGEVIRFAVGECSLGRVLVAVTSKGVCAILLGHDPGRLERELHERFPHARIVHADTDFEATVSAVVRLVEHPDVPCNLPLDIRGTAFQERVWRALQTIPAGTKVSYADLAKRIGAPAAVRAVAQACGANVLAIAVPCHRVVRSDGNVSGYRWGVSRKRALLAREGEAS